MRPPIDYLNYYYRTLEKQKQQHIVIDGQFWTTADQLQTKLKEANSSGKSPIEFFGLDKLAQSLAEKMEMFLRKDHQIHLIGHSIGGCVAMILAQILQSKKMKVPEVITYGQPNIFPTIIPKKTQVLRVVNPQDHVTQIFPGVKEVGQRLTLLQEGHYCYEREPTEKESVAIDSLSESRLGYNHMNYYVRFFQTKSKSVAVSPANMADHIPE
uniref:Fungal lipase-type domain-containing protein n=1 Tax=Paramoeba aestuarina TaxID=180227 RepID=A0A7S4PM47_9EUKA|eukprot:CAMPEP_0201511120 /NCGR_PEP_ID=MMETSP0161_2-20130828/3619_1 /ASSEMBLY_ACC=CAM_ASM_000251 /TAXON_ID=180227 /ORGANISM="Neoparamoeba aestuarina, Strain SoJaBio B1-5/56/2" /LENGTH=211 /DNA_ID=CAMNT_0047906471 /DNA_START=23 /DNA_END=658 /DNA_ORIENTATION=+